MQSSSSVFTMTSPSCSSTSPPADLTDVFSDDSGVDVKSQLVKQSPGPADTNSKRNKRKSSEPKKRKDVLLMKRFRWDSDEEDSDLRADSGIELEPPTKVVTGPEPSAVPEPSRQSVICPPTPRGGSRSGARGGGKTMTKQKRKEANARERSRVHTIGAAFESLRQAVPAYAHNQKLSKLAVLRIASAYILALACLAERDGSQEQQESGPTLAECVDQCTRTVQAEGRSRRRTTKE